MNNILRNAIRACLATSAAAGAYSAMALTPADFTGSEPNNTLRFSGATATDGIIRNRVGAFCADDDANTATPSTVASVYHSVQADGIQIAMLCRGNNVVAALNNVDFAFLKESEAGSANGSVVVASNTPQTLQYLDVFNAGFTCFGGTSTSTANDGVLDGDPGEFPGTTVASIVVGGATNTVRAYFNCTPQANFTAEAGISDVEQRLLGGTGTQAQATRAFQIMFGVPVSLNLYRALQAAQGLNVDGAATCATTPDIPACAPSLPRSTVAAIYDNTILDWGQVVTNTGAPLTTIDIPGTAGAPADTQVYICRRGNSSGTQIGTRAYFLRQGCGGSQAFVGATNGTANADADGNPYGDPLAGVLARIDLNKDGDISDLNEGLCDFQNTLVFAGDGSGDVRNCLDDRDDLNRWAIGVASLDSTVDGTVVLTAGPTVAIGNINGDGGTARETSGTGGIEAFSREYRFVRLDGQLPDLATAANGAYDFYTENVAYARTGQLTGVEQTLYNALFTSATTAISRQANISNTACDDQPWGDGCSLGIPGHVGNSPLALTPANPAYTQANMITNKTNSTTKSILGAVNNCNAPTSFQGGVTQAILGPTP